MLQGLQIGGTSAHFPKFVIHLGNAFYELRKAMGTSKYMNSSVVYRFDIPMSARGYGIGMSARLGSKPINSASP